MQTKGTRLLLVLEFYFATSCCADAAVPLALPASTPNERMVLLQFAEDFLCMHAAEALATDSQDCSVKVKSMQCSGAEMVVLLSFAEKSMGIYTPCFQRWLFDAHSRMGLRSIDGLLHNAQTQQRAAEFSLYTSIE